ncbi:hypothetical protein SLS61_003210 [Didymella pomorum]
MLAIGISFTLLGCGLNTLYTLRFPSISLTQSAVQFLAFPIGKIWEKVVPDWTLSVMGWSLRLIPGPSNQKRVFFGYQTGWGFEISITLAAAILYGFSIAGICKSIVVDPSSMLWPGVFANTALNHALHSSKAESESMYFTFVCWAAPKNTIVNQLFGMESGLGLVPSTFGWSQIAYIGSPLVVPTWAIANVLAALVFWVYIISPALYYSNMWNSAYLPIQSNSVFDNTGKTYNIYLPITYALNQFGLAFAAIVSLFIWQALEKRYQIWSVLMSIKTRPRSSTGKYGADQPAFAETPTWWIIAGYVWEGKVLANIWFFNLGYISGIKALQFSQDFKLGLYYGIPPRQLFIVQLVAICIATIAQVGVLNWALTNISGVCTSAAVNGFTCPFPRTHFNTSTI